MRHVALEIPLRPLTVTGLLQSNDAADARIEPLGDSLDNAALAGRIAPFENDRDLRAGMLHPVLQFDQLRLQADQRSEIGLAFKGFGVLALVDSAQFKGKGRLGQFQFIILVERVLQLRFEPVAPVVLWLIGLVHPANPNPSIAWDSA